MLLETANEQEIIEICCSCRLSLCSGTAVDYDKI